MPIDDPNSEKAPVAQNSMPNHGATMVCRRSPSIFRKPALLGSPGCPYKVECASIDVRQMVTMLTAANVHVCSTLAKRHQRCQRTMFAGVGSNVYDLTSSAAAISSP